MLNSILLISIGASLGALLRWALGLALNPLLAEISPGTLAANLIGAYLVGVAMAYFAWHPALPPEWRLLVITGFLGGLTTFSSFSAEVVLLLQQQRLLWAAAAILLHVAGSLIMTLLGIASVALVKRL